MGQHFTPGGALAEILRRDLEAGIDVFDDHGVPRPTLGPPVSYAPLERPRFPEPDWRAEEKAAARRDAAAAPAPALEDAASLGSRPAKRRRKSSTSKTEVHSATPNLDEVRSWVEVER